MNDPISEIPLKARINAMYQLILIMNRNREKAGLIHSIDDYIWECKQATPQEREEAIACAKKQFYE
jgi:PHD/YefM family antitoxin component YafN of YafNO toxin-antitoxin module